RNDSQHTKVPGVTPTNDSALVIDIVVYVDPARHCVRARAPRYRWMPRTLRSCQRRDCGAPPALLSGATGSARTGALSRRIGAQTGCHGAFQGAGAISTVGLVAGELRSLLGEIDRAAAIARGRAA